MATTPNYDINYDDERFGKVESDKSQALAELESTYSGMIDSADDFYDDLKNQHQEWADKQAEIQQQQTDFAIEKIEQQKEQAEKDYLKEQSASYVDWQKQSNKYGTEAEKMASAGLTNTGYSESSQVSMYNTYQNRVATAREVLSQAKLNYDNGIKEAILQNNAAIAEIYATNYLKQAELALQGFQYKNELLLEQANKKLEIKNMYHNQWMDVLQQINTENAMAEEVRQYNETMKWNNKQAELNRQHDKDLKALQYRYDKDLQEIKYGYDEKLAEIEQNYKLAYLNASTAKEKEMLDKEHALEIEKLNKQRENQEKLLKYEYDLQKGSAIKITGDDDDTGSVPIKSSSGFTGSTYSEAVAYMKSKGVSSAAASSAMTENEWRRRKSSYSMTGQGGEEVKNYSSYKAYLFDYVDYCIANEKAETESKADPMSSININRWGAMK